MCYEYGTMGILHLWNMRTNLQVLHIFGTRVLSTLVTWLLALISIEEEEEGMKAQQSQRIRKAF